MFSVSFFCVVSGSSDMRACRADNESVRKTAFLGFSSHEMMDLALECAVSRNNKTSIFAIEMTLT